MVPRFCADRQTHAVAPYHDAWISTARQALWPAPGLSSSDKRLLRYSMVRGICLAVTGSEHISISGASLGLSSWMCIGCLSSLDTQHGVWGAASSKCFAPPHCQVGGQDQPGIAVWHPCTSRVEIRPRRTPSTQAGLRVTGGISDGHACLRPRPHAHSP